MCVVRAFFKENLHEDLRRSAASIARWNAVAAECRSIVASTPLADGRRLRLQNFVDLEPSAAATHPQPEPDEPSPNLNPDRQRDAKLPDPKPGDSGAATATAAATPAAAHSGCPVASPIHPSGVCPFLGREAWISASGRFDPCCAPDAERRKLGDFGSLTARNDSPSLQSLWDGAGYQSLIKNYWQRPLCRGCNLRLPAQTPEVGAAATSPQAQ